jgi:hypothetical protein
MLRPDFEHKVTSGDLTLRSPANWTAVFFFGALGGLHLSMAGFALALGRWEAFLSVIFGIVFSAAAVACALVRSEVTVLREHSHLRLRTGFRNLCFERLIPFEAVKQVRLTLMNRRSLRDSRIEIVCEGESIECPPTDIPRQEALCLALTMGVRLVKVYGQGVSDVSERINNLTNA